MRMMMDRVMMGMDSNNQCQCCPQYLPYAVIVIAPIQQQVQSLQQPIEQPQQPDFQRVQFTNNNNSEGGGSFKLYVGNLSYRCERLLFAQGSKGFAFVTM